MPKSSAPRLIASVRVRAARISVRAPEFQTHFSNRSTQRASWARNGELTKVKAATLNTLVFVGMCSSGFKCAHIPAGDAFRLGCPANCCWVSAPGALETSAACSPRLFPVWPFKIREAGDVTFNVIGLSFHLVGFNNDGLFLFCARPHRYIWINKNISFNVWLKII